MLHSWLPVPYAGRGPSSYVMLLIGLVRRTGYMYANMGFYDKTNIVILTCTSDDSLPSSPLRCVAVVELGTLVSVSWFCPGGLPDVRDGQRAFCTHGRGKNVVHKCRGG